MTRNATAARRTDESKGSAPRAKYTPPEKWQKLPMEALLENVRAISPQQQGRLGIVEEAEGRRLPVAFVYYAGDLELLKAPRVAIVGTRKLSADGAKRAAKLARELADGHIVVVSGLAEGVDGVAHRAAIEAGGRTIAVIGTPLDKAYPVQHSELQEKIYREHLLISQFAHGARVFPSNFPQRNRVMAAMTDATIIIEASDTSGTLHQAAACAALGRWLFIAKSVAEDPKLTWPKRFVGLPFVRVLSEVDDVVRVFERTQ